MIGIDIAGVRTSYETLNRTHAKCFLCDAASECQIMKYDRHFYFFHKKVFFFDEQFWFSWHDCSHRAVLSEKEDVARYKQEQVETGVLAVPYYSTMKLQFAALRPISWLEIIFLSFFILIGIAAFVGFAEFVKAKFHAPFIP